MPRAIWTGSLSFGLVNIPVDVHTAVRENRPRFRMLHAKDHSPISFERVCQKDQQTVAWEDIVKGYEYEKGRYVVLTKDDLETAALEKTRRIEILDFVKAEAIDDRFFDKPYYLIPSKGGDVAYALLREAIRETDRIGIAKFIFHEVQHLAAIEAIRDALVLSTLRFAGELVDAGTFTFPSGSHIDKRDLGLAKTLVQNLASEWKPEKYKDDYSDNLMRVIKAKLKGKQARLVSDEPDRGSKVVDLMERLKRSLEATRGRSTAKASIARSKATAGKKRRTKAGAAA